MSGPEPVRCAVLGTGAIAQVAHLPILARMPGVELTGLFDTDAGKARTLAERLGAARVYGAVGEVLEDPDVDAVVIATPSHLHELQVGEALAAGKYVFCEKPLAVDAEGARRVLEVSGSESRLMVGMNQRFRPDAMALCEIVAAGKLGEISSLRAGWLTRRVAPGRRTWRHRRAGAGGGALMDLGIQLLDLCLWLLNYPTPLRLVAHTRRTTASEVEDSAVLVLELEGGTVVNLEVTWDLVSDRDRQYMALQGSVGSASLPPLRVLKEVESGVEDISPPPAAGRENLFTASYRAELAHFVSAVRGETTLRPPTEQVTLLRLIQAAYASAEAGREVHL